MGFQQGFRINTNTAALDTYRAYSKSQAGLEQNIERLSSGLRINSAKDDAAGLAISERMNNQVRGMQQANRNVQQANNLLQTAEGGLNEISNILGRMRELAVQSASDGVNIDDRASINLELQQLKGEVNRIANSTTYNSMNLLDGSRGGSNGVGSTQVTGTGEITNITDLMDSSDGLSAPLGLTIHNDQIYWTDQSTVKIQRSDLDGSNITDLVDSSDGLSGPQDLTIYNDQIYWVDPGTDKIQRSDLDGSNITDLVDSSDGLSDPVGLTIHNDQIYWVDAGTNKIQQADLDGSNVTDLVDSSDGLEGPQGLTIHNNQIYWTDFSTVKIQRSDLDGSNVTDLVDSSDGLIDPLGLTIHNDQIYWTDPGTNKIQQADLNLGILGDGTSDFTLQIGADNFTDDRMIFGIDSVTTDSLLLTDTDMETLSDAQTIINSLDAAIDFINDQRSNLGAVQNRLEFTSSNLMNSIQNNSASMSTIRDADFAAEAAELAKHQILTQSGTAMLAQANSLSQNVLSLIR